MQKKYQEDLDEFLKLTKTKRGSLVDKDYPNEYWHLNFYQLHSETLLKDFIKNLKLETKELDDYTFNYYVNVIIKYMSGSLDSHTELRFINQIRLPYECKYFPDEGLYIKYLEGQKAKIAKILKINGIDVNGLIAMYEKRVSYASKSHLYKAIELNFSVLEILYSLPNLPRLENLIILETDKGTLKINLSEEMTMKDNKTPDYYVRDTTMLFKYKSCHFYYIPVIKNLLEELDRLVVSGNIDRFILDLRGNGGGASSIIKPLIEYLKNKNLELITIVDRGVFSSGRFAAVEMQMIGSKIVGEEIGTPINCFGNILKPSPLKNTNQQPIFTKTYWYLDDVKKKMVGIMQKSDLVKHNETFFTPQFLKLDEEYEESVEDFLNGYDILLENSWQIKKKRQ